jgi:hypothetical protein
MDKICTYQIEIRGRMDENDLNKMSPIDITVMRVNPAATRFTIHADQSGLIGLIRHLHGQGFVLLSVIRER